MKGLPVAGEWETAYFCKECNKELSYDDKMGSNGLCTYCGNAEGTTIIETNKKAKRWITTSISLFKGERGYWEFRK